MLRRIMQIEIETHGELCTVVIRDPLRKGSDGQGLVVQTLTGDTRDWVAEGYE